MKITRERLMNIIREELMDAFRGAPNDENDRQRRNRLFQGWDEFKRSSVGIYEKDKKKKKNCIRGNPWHDRLGRLTSPSDDSGSWSIDKDGEHDDGSCRSGQARRPSANKKTVWTKIKCGRGPDGKGKEKHLCKGGKLWEEMEEIRFEDGRHLQSWMNEMLLDVLDEHENDMEDYDDDIVLGEDKAVQVRAYCDRMGLKSLKDWLAIQNKMVASAKGDLFKDK